MLTRFTNGSAVFATIKLNLRKRFITAYIRYIIINDEILTIVESPFDVRKQLPKSIVGFFRMDGKVTQ